jgi:hypothetical protein
VRDEPEATLARVLALRAAPDRIVGTLFLLRGVRGADLVLERFSREVLRLEQVERTPTTRSPSAAASTCASGASFAAEPVAGGSRLVTERRVSAADRRSFLVSLAAADHRHRSVDVRWTS